MAINNIPIKENSFTKKIGMRNQFVMAPLKLGYSDGNGHVTDKHFEFYLRRAKHVGAIILEPLYIHPGLRELPTQLGISDDKHIEGLNKLIKKIHEEGAKVIAHLNHPGRMANPKIPNNFFVSSTDRACENGGARPKRMDKNMIKEAIQLVVDAAIRAEKAGFDAVELQYGHGYLVAQFLSPAVNDRKDEYNGSLENRARFGLELLNAVKEKIKIPIIIRLSGDEMNPNGFHLDEMVEFSKMLEEKGADAIHIIGGSACSGPHWFFQHMFIPKGKLWDFADKIQSIVKIPVMYVGRINENKDISMLINERNAQLISIGRAFVADPDFLGKVLGKIDEPYRPCLACSEGCLGGVKSGRGLHCAVNPLVGENESITIEKTENKKKIWIVGGGPAGLEAAITLKKRGHDIEIYERDRLGGQFNLAYLPPMKGGLKKLIDYYEKMIQKYGIIVHNEEFTVEKFENNNVKPDMIILATGAEPAVPPIKGLKEYYWAEVLNEENLPTGKNTVVIGGGLIGMEIADALIQKENKVTIIEMLEEIGRGMEMLEKKFLQKLFASKKVAILLNTKVTEIDGSIIKFEGSQSGSLENIDLIVLATGMRSYNPLYEKLKDKIPVEVVGDAKSVGKVQDAIKNAFETSLKL